MAKIVAEKVQEITSADSPKIVEIKHTRTMQDASGNDVEVVDFVDVTSVDDAIAQCESRKANLESQLTECESELTDLIAIRDAE